MPAPPAAFKLHLIITEASQSSRHAVRAPDHLRVHGYRKNAAVYIGVHPVELGLPDFHMARSISSRSCAGVCSLGSTWA